MEKQNRNIDAFSLIENVLNTPGVRTKFTIYSSAQSATTGKISIFKNKVEDLKDD
jgi:hypothetical protein